MQNINCIDTAVTDYLFQPEAHHPNIFCDVTNETRAYYETLRPIVERLMDSEYDFYFSNSEFLNQKELSGTVHYLYKK